MYSLLFGHLPGEVSNRSMFSTLQGVYYYFYQLLKNEAEARSRRSWKMGNADTSVGMLSSLIIAAIAGYEVMPLPSLQDFH